MQVIGHSVPLGDIMTVLIIYIGFYTGNINEQKLHGDSKWRSRVVQVFEQVFSDQ